MRWLAYVASLAGAFFVLQWVLGLVGEILGPDADAPVFELFFALPEHRRWAYLAGRDDLRGHLGAMAALFAAADWPLRARLVVPALLPPSPAHL